MKEKIIELHKKGLSYNQIKDELGCSKSTISYHCGQGRKERQRLKQKNTRDNNPLIRRVEKFQLRTYNKPEIKRQLTKKEELCQKIHCFRKRGISMEKFKWQDVITKFGKKTRCYLSGQPIDLINDSGKYTFDHKLAVSKGGDNSLDNLGITLKIMNQMKSDQSVEELIENCKLILQHQGYKITKK